MTLDKQQLNSSQTNVNNGEVNADNCYIMSNCKENKERSSELSKKEREGEFRNCWKLKGNDKTFHFAHTD